MFYTIEGSRRFAITKTTAERLLYSLKADLLDFHVETENDRHPFHWMTIKGPDDLTDKAVKDAFGMTFELKEKQDGH